MGVYKVINKIYKTEKNAVIATGVAVEDLNVFNSKVTSRTQTPCIMSFNGASRRI